MGRIDTETKAFMSDTSRFADAFNYLIYDGQPVIKPKDLKPLDTTEIAIPYGNNARVPEQKYRDVLQFIKCSKDEEALSRLAEDNERFVRMNPETAELINLITDSRLKLTVEEGTVNMCQAIQQMRERSKADGMVEGRLDTLVSLVKKNRLTLQEAAEEAEMTVDEFVKKTGIKPLVN